MAEAMREPAPEVSPQIEAFLRKVPEKAARLMLAGSHRISLELRHDPPRAAFYIRKYEDLISSMAGVLEGQLRGMKGKAKEEAFIKGIWSLMKSNLRFTYQMEEYLHRILQTNKVDCDTSAFMVNDVAKLLGIRTNLVYVPGHTILRTDYFLFETSEFKSLIYSDIRNLPEKHALSYTVPKGMEAAEDHRTMAHLQTTFWRYEDALRSIGRAIGINPSNPFFYQSRILICLQLAGHSPDPKDARRYLDLAREDEARVERMIGGMVGKHLPLYRTFALSIFFRARASHLASLLAKTDDGTRFRSILAQKQEAKRREVEEAVKEVSAKLSIPGLSSDVRHSFLDQRSMLYEWLGGLLKDQEQKDRMHRLAERDRKEAAKLRR